MLETILISGVLGTVGLGLGSLGTWIAVRRSSTSQLNLVRGALTEERSRAERERDGYKEIVSRCQTAFRAWLAYEDHTRRALQTWASRVADLETRSSARQGGSSLVERRYPVFLDGCSGSGKTTFALSLLTPTWLQQGHPVPQANVHAVRTPPMPVAVEEGGEGRSVLHTLFFYDTAGEVGAGLIDCCEQYRAERGKDAPQGVLLFVWDCAQPEETNKQFLRERVNNVWRSGLVKQTIRAVVVFFNKTDALESPRGLGAPRRDVREQLERFKQTAQSPGLLEPKLIPPGGVHFADGSLINGAGLQACYGTILSLFGLSRLLDRKPVPVGQDVATMTFIMDEEPPSVEIDDGSRSPSSGGSGRK